MTADVGASRSEGKKPREWRLCQTVTAFVDLLGLSNALGDLDRIVADDLDREAATSLMQASLGRVLRFRNLFAEMYRALAERPAPAPEGLPPELARLWTSSLTSDTRIAHFSDCILLNIVVDRSNIVRTARGMVDMCMCLGYATLHTMADGQLVRGAIDAGVAFDGGEQEVLGSGLVHAYYYESRVATYPRICVGPHFMGLVSAIEQPDGRDDIRCTPLESALLKRHAALLRDMIASDLDGVPRLRLDHPWILDAFRATGESDILGRVVGRLDAMAAATDSIHQPDIYKKVLWARNTLAASLARARKQPPAADGT